MFAIVGEVDEHEIADARRYAKTKLRELVRQPGTPSLIMLDAACNVLAVMHGGDPGLYGRGIDVERAAHAVDRIHDMKRPVHPAEAGAAQTYLGEGPGHDDIFIPRDQLDPGLIVVAPHILGIGGVDHEQD